MLGLLKRFPKLVHIRPNVEPKPIVLRIRYKDENTEDLLIPIFLTADVQQLKYLIMDHDNRFSPYAHMILSCEGHPSLDNYATLDKYGIYDGMTIFLHTEFEVNLVGPGSTRNTVTIVAFATSSVLQLLLHDLERTVGSGLGHCSDPIFLCAGEVLRDDRKLGSFRQLTPGCEIYVNNKKNTGDYMNRAR